MARLLSFPTILASGFLVALLYARSTGELQLLFLIPTVILPGGAAVCYLWIRHVQIPLSSYAVHVAALLFVWGLYWLYRNGFLGNWVSSVWMAIALYASVAFCTFYFSMRLCRRVACTSKWAAVLLALFPASMIALSPAVTRKPNQGTSVFHFGSVAARIQFNGIAPLNFEIYRYYTSTRTVSIPKAVSIGGTLYTDVKLQSVYLRVDAQRRKPDSAVLEVIRKDEHVQYLTPNSVHFDDSTFEIAAPENATVSGQLVINSNDSIPYDWDVFYHFPCAGKP